MPAHKLTKRNVDNSLTCELCGGVDVKGTLTTHCSMVGIPYHYERAIGNGDLDYINGKWSPSPLRAMLDKENREKRVYCPRCNHDVPLTDDGESCAFCKLVL